MIVRAFAIQTGALVFSAITDTDSTKYDAWFSRVLQFYHKGFMRILDDPGINDGRSVEVGHIKRAIFEIIYALIFYIITVSAYASIFLDGFGLLNGSVDSSVPERRVAAPASFGASSDHVSLEGLGLGVLPIVTLRHGSAMIRVRAEAETHCVQYQRTGGTATVRTQRVSDGVAFSIPYVDGDAYATLRIERRARGTCHGARQVFGS